MKPAPPLDCSVCGRPIGKKAGHYLLEGDRLACMRCVEKKALHAEIFTDCPHAWHDLLDHLQSTGTRAGMAMRLNLWPAARAALHAARKDTT
jgi:hypothetical protein